MNQFEKHKKMKVVMKKVEGLVVSDDMLDETNTRERISHEV